jgi:hypothetical protein
MLSTKLLHGPQYTGARPSEGYSRMETEQDPRIDLCQLLALDLEALRADAATLDIELESE